MNRDNDKGKVLIHRSIIWQIIQVFLFVLIFLRLVYLQVFQADKFQTMADENRISTRLLVPPRGVIFDRNDIMIAGNQQNFQAMIVAEQTADVEATLEAFKDIIPLSAKDEERIKKDLKKYRRFMPIKIKDALSWEDVSAIVLASSDLPGIIIDDGLNRNYPFGKELAHVLGYVSAVSERDLSRDSDPLLGLPGFKIGKDGIEKMLEKQLRGKGGNQKLEVNAIGRVIKEIERVDGIPGDNINLSIDVRLQKKAIELFGQESGAAIVMNAHNGEILAFVSTPSYDSNDFALGVSHSLYADLLKNEKSPLMNKAIAGQYSPGSAFKMVVALAALEEKIITPYTKIDCNGHVTLGNHTFHCWKKGGHGEINLIEALQHSCDVFFYEVAQKLGIDKIAAMARRFGLGKATGIGFSNEKSGLVPDRAWKMSKLKEPWQTGETLIVGIGQGSLLTTPVQLAVMTAAIANNGHIVKPTFILGDKQNKNSKRLNINPEYFRAIKQGMYNVINEPGGTAFGSRFDINGKKMSGKTGTTQVRRISMQERQTGIIAHEDTPWKYRNHALFVGYAPHDNPKYIIVVIVEHGGGGGGVAAPIASKLMQEILRLDEEGK